MYKYFASQFQIWIAKGQNYIAFYYVILNKIFSDNWMCANIDLCPKLLFSISNVGYEMNQSIKRSIILNNEGYSLKLNSWTQQQNRGMCEMHGLYKVKTNQLISKHCEKILLLNVICRVTITCIHGGLKKSIIVQFD